MAGKKTAPAATATSATGAAGNGAEDSGGEGSGKTAPQPTANEAMLFYTIIKNMKTKPDIDWHAVAEEAGFKNADTAKVRFGQIKRKLGLDTAVGTSKAPASVGGGKKSAGANGALGAATKAGVAKKTGRAKAAAAAAGTKAKTAKEAASEPVPMKPPTKIPRTNTVKHESDTSDHGSLVAMKDFPAKPSANGLESGKEDINEY